MLATSCRAVVGEPTKGSPDDAGADAVAWGAARLDGSTGEDAASSSVCGPTGGGPYWLEETVALVVPIRCSTGRMLSSDAFDLANVPPGAVYDSGTATLTWKPNLDQAGVYVVAITAKAFGETGEIRIGVADKFYDPANVPIKDPAVYTEEFGLPVFHIQTTPDLEKKLPALIASYHADQSCQPICPQDFYTPVTVIYRGHKYQAEGHYRGASSLFLPKKNYTLRFDKTDKFTEPVLAGGRIRQRNHIALITTFDDNSYVRWRMAFELWNRLDPGIIRIEHYSAVVYLDGAYYGLYAVADKIDDDMMERNGLSKDGNIYAGASHDGNFQILSTETGTAVPRDCPWLGFAKKSGLPDVCDGKTFVPGAFDDLLPFTDLVSRADDTRFQAGIGQSIAVKDYVDWFVLATAIKAGDSYAKNGYHYHDPAGGPWRMVLWDYNDSFGQDWATVRRPATGDPAGVPMPPADRQKTFNNLWKRLWEHPIHGPAMRARYASSLKNELKLADVLAFLDLAARETEASAKRDERKWGGLYREYYGGNRSDLTTSAKEILYVRQWITNRWEYLQSLYR